MSNSKLDSQPAISNHETECFFAAMRLENNELSLIHYNVEILIETINKIITAFEAIPQTELDDKTIYEALQCALTRIVNISTSIDLSEQTNELSEAIGYQVDRSEAIINLLIPSFAANNALETNDKTIYHALKSVLLELAEIKQGIVEFDAVHA